MTAARLRTRPSPTKDDIEGAFAMHNQAGQLISSNPPEPATEPKAREAAARPTRRQATRKAPDIHPSLRALPDYPE